MIEKTQSDHENWYFPFCPVPPDWDLDWHGIVSSFEWVRQMDGVPQDPIYHAEGDLLIHARIVLENLISARQWQKLDPQARSILFAAALMHDIAKPKTTKIEPHGRPTARGHARWSEKVARKILWESIDIQPTPFNQRELVTGLVRYHGLPLYFLDKKSMEKEIFKTSQMIRMDWIALLSEADVKGRFCKDKHELLERVDLFREFCQDHLCYGTVRQFPSDHSRFQYFRNPDRQPGYHAFDDTKFDVFLMSGLPGSGKDTWIHENRPQLPVISLDMIRKELNCPPTGNQGKVIQFAREKAREFMRKRESFIWNGTNLTNRLRHHLVDLFFSYGARIHILYREAPYAELIRRNRNRKNPVPEKALQKMIDILEIPEITEAHSVEYVVD